MWAKANDINSSKDRTMSSMAIIALVAFHLQVLNDSFPVLILILFCNCTILTSNFFQIAFGSVQTRNPPILPPFLALLRGNIFFCYNKGHI